MKGKTKWILVVVGKKAILQITFSKPFFIVKTSLFFCETRLGPIRNGLLPCKLFLIIIILYYIIIIIIIVLLLLLLLLLSVRFRSEFSSCSS